MTDRVSTDGPIQQAILRMQLQTTSIADLEDQISSGIRLSKPSVNPFDYVQVRSDQADANRFDIYRANVSTLSSVLDAGVSALQDVNQVLTSARSIAIQGADATTDAEGDAALANEVDGLIQRLVDVSNSSVNGRYLFGGTATDHAPFAVTAADPQGRPTQVTYQGANERGRALVGPGQTIDTLYVGSQVFQQPGADVFQALMGLRDDLRNPALTQTQREQAVGQRLAQLEKAQSTIRDQLGQQSTSLETLRALDTQLGNLKLASQTRTTNLEGADISQAIVSLQEQQNLYQATLAITSRLFSNSFLDFMR